MSRIPPLPRSDLNEEQQSLHDKASMIAEKGFGDKFIYKRDDGALLGPFAPLIHSKVAGGAFLDFIIAGSKTEGLAAEPRETAILTVGSHFQAAYELYSHERIAAVDTKLTKTQIDLIKTGKKPDDLDEACSIAFDVATELVKKPGPLSIKKWDTAVEVLGKDGTLALIHFVCGYAYICVLLNACDVAVPEEEHIK